MSVMHPVDAIYCGYTSRLYGGGRAFTFHAHQAEEAGVSETG